jgi:hypothetical protein
MNVKITSSLISCYYSDINQNIGSEKMTLLIILLTVFAAVALMVILGERFGSPMDEEQQSKYSKVLPILVFILILGGIIKMAMG